MSDLFAQLDDFRMHLIQQRGFRDTTAHGYGEDVKDLLRYIREKAGRAPQPEDLVPDMLQGWLTDGQVERAHQPLTVNRRRSAAATFCKYLRRRRLLTGNPCADLLVPKVREVVPKFLRKEVAEAIVKKPLLTRPAGSLHGLRDHLINLLLYEGGFRACEISSMDTDRLQFDFPLEGFCAITVIGKGGKERVVPVKKAVPVLKEYLARRCELSPPAGEKALFLQVRQPTERLLPTAVGAMVRSYGKIGPHRFRHTFATLGLLGGAEPRAIQDAMGHESARMTKRYAASNALYIAQKATLFHPANQDTRPLSLEEQMKALGERLEQRLEHLERERERTATPPRLSGVGLFGRASLWLRRLLRLSDGGGAHLA